MFGSLSSEQRADFNLIVQNYSSELDSKLGYNIYKVRFRHPVSGPRSNSNKQFPADSII